MSQENVEIAGGVRTPITVRSETKRRTVDQWIFVRFPALFRVFASAWSRWPPRFRLRRAFVSRLVRLGCEAANRRDFDVLLLGLDPEIEFRFGEGSAVGGLAPPDLDKTHCGHAAYLGLWDAIIEAMDDIALKHEEVIDFGERLFAAGRFTGHGTSSGVPISQAVFQVFTLRRGLVVRQEDFADRDRALEAVGLSE